MDNKDFSTPAESGAKFEDIERIVENTHHSKYILSPATPTESEIAEFKKLMDNKGQNLGVIWSKERPKNKFSFDWMIFLMCLGFAISFILGYLACLIISL